MINQADKPKDMARSILPSTWRGAWKKRAGLHRGARHAARRSLRTLTRDPASWDAGLEFGDEYAVELSTLVHRRRQSDKLKHFARWAVERTKALPLEARLSHLRSLLPGGLIGQHAMLHLKHREELQPETEHDRVWRAKWRRTEPYLDAGLISVLLRKLHEVHGGVRFLHRALKSAQRVGLGGYRVSVPFRALQGLSDVGDFVRWLKTERSALDVVDSFCREFRATGDAERAYLSASMRAAMR